MKTDYKKADKRDIDILASMNKKLIEDEGHSNPMTINDLAIRMEGFLNGEYEAYLILHESIPSGYCLFRDDGDYIYVRQLYIERNLRKQELGSSIIKYLRNRCWVNRKIRVEVLCHNKNGLDFWRRIGFKDYCITMQYEEKEMI